MSEETASNCQICVLCVRNFSWAIELEIWCASSIFPYLSLRFIIKFSLARCWHGSGVCNGTMLLLLSLFFSIDIRSENAIMMHFLELRFFFYWLCCWLFSPPFLARCLLFMLMSCMCSRSCAALSFFVAVTWCASAAFYFFIIRLLLLACSRRLENFFMCSFFLWVYIVCLFHLFTFLSRTLLGSKTIEIDFSS